MKIFTGTMRLSALCAGTLLTVSTAWAAETADTDATLEEVVVTGSRLTTGGFSAPIFRVSVFRPETLVPFKRYLFEQERQDDHEATH